MGIVAFALSLAMAEDLTASPPIDAAADAGATSSARWLPLVMLALGVMAAALIMRARMLRLRVVPNRAVVFSPPTAFMLVAIAFILPVIAVRIGARVMGIELAPDITMENEIRLNMWAAGAQLLLAGAFFSVASRRPPGRRPSALIAVVRGVLAMVLLWPILQTLGFGLDALVTLMQGEPPDAISHQKLEMITQTEPDQRRWLILMLVQAIIVAPIVEEVIYRGLMQDGLDRLGLPRWTSIIVTSIIFMLMHAGAVKWHALPVLFILSMGFGVLYERNGRLAAPIAMHMLFNATNVVLAMWVLG